jgi:hypothetical protein
LWVMSRFAVYSGELFTKTVAKVRKCNRKRRRIMLFLIPA